MAKFKKETKKTVARELIFASFFAALIFVATSFLPRIPTALGYVHPGDGFVLIAASALPMPYALAAAAVGGTLADLLSGYVIYAPATLIIKMLMALCISSRTRRIASPRNLIGILPATIINSGGYYLYESLFVANNFIVPLAEIPFNLLQTAVGGVIFVIVALIFDRTPSIRDILPRERRKKESEGSQK